MPPRLRHRSLSVVVHNIHPGHKNEIEKELCSHFDVKDVIISEEPYPDKPGHHLHLFVRFKAQVSKSVLIEFCETHCPRMTGKNELGTLGHIKCKFCYKENWDQAVAKYLTNPVKDKKIDDDVPIITRSASYRPKKHAPTALCTCAAYGFEKVYVKSWPLHPTRPAGWYIRPIKHPFDPPHAPIYKPTPYCDPASGELCEPPCAPARPTASQLPFEHSELLSI